MHPGRRSVRLREFVYSKAGAYFVTICTKDRECLFGEILGDRMVLNEFGEIAKAEWLRTSEIRPNVDLDAFVIMPNHLHGNLFLRDWADVGAHCNVPLPKHTPNRRIRKIHHQFYAYNNQIVQIYGDKTNQ